MGECPPGVVVLGTFMLDPPEDVMRKEACDAAGAAPDSQTQTKSDDAAHGARQSFISFPCFLAMPAQQGRSDGQSATVDYVKNCSHNGDHENLEGKRMLRLHSKSSRRTFANASVQEKRRRTKESEEAEMQATQAQVHNRTGVTLMVMLQQVTEVRHGRGRARSIRTNWQQNDADLPASSV